VSPGARVRITPCSYFPERSPRRPSTSRQTRRYLEYLDRHGSLAPRLCESGVRAWVVFGDRDDIGLTDNEREALEKCPDVTTVTISDAGHFTLNEKPGQIAELVLDAVASTTLR
jgi:pimeloyl-ACP methyl ester carboxylesterase